MKDTHVLVFEHDILKYPPILSVISFLLSQNKKVILIGYCSDQTFIDEFITKGVVFHIVINNNISDNVVKKFFKYCSFKRKVSNLLKSYDANTVKVWLFGEQCIWLLHKLVYKYDTNAYLFEIPSFSVNLRYRLLSFSLNYKLVLQIASKVVCCEYNRAHITKSFFQLEDLPLVIPNKPNYDSISIDDSIADNYLSNYKDKKIILYQGVFNYPERKLDEFCETIPFLPDEYILVLMGTDNWYRRQLKNKYESERIVFLPYIVAPNHLSITKRAHIGILIYNGVGGQIENTLNTLYCAPNKIHEYSKYGIPMISNDIPGLTLVFDNYKMGHSIRDLNPLNIASIISIIEKDYENYSDKAMEYYETTNLEKKYSYLI